MQLQQIPCLFYTLIILTIIVGVFEQDGILPKTSTPEKLGRSVSKGPELRKRIGSPSARRPRRKRRSGNKDSIRENLSSSNLRLFSPTSSDQKEENKQNAAIPNFSNGSNSSITVTKQMPTSSSQSLFSFPDGSTPRKTQTRRRIRSQSKLSELLTSSSNESLLSNK